VKSSVFLSPTDFMASTDGINPSVKLDNVVVDDDDDDDDEEEED